jgi:hypothetical protein
MPRCRRALRTTRRVGLRPCREGHVCRSRSLLARTRSMLARATEATRSRRGACGFHIRVIRAAGRPNGADKNTATGPKEVMTHSDDEHVDGWPSTVGGDGRTAAALRARLARSRCWRANSRRSRNRRRTSIRLWSRLLLIPARSSRASRESSGDEHLATI